MVTTSRAARAPGPAVNRLDHVDQALYARWVRTATALTTLGYGIVTVAGLFTHHGLWYGFFSQAPTTLLAATAWFLAGRGRTGPAAVIALVAVWLELHADLPLVGVQGSGLIAFPLVVMASGFLRGGRGALLVAAVTTVTVPLTAVVGFWLRGVPVPDPAGMAYLVVVCSASMLAAAALVELGIDSFDRVLAKAMVSEERVAALVANAPDGIVATDGDGYIVSANPEAVRLLGDPATPLAGQDLHRMVLAACLRPEDREAVRALLGRRDVSVSLRLQSADPGGVEVEAVATLIPWADGSEGTQVTLRDVTERRRAEENESFLRAQLEHSQRLEAVGRLAGGVAHDFNNLLTVVGVSAEMLLDETEGHTRALARDILEAKIRGSALTKQLLAFARKDPIQVKRLSLSEVLRDQAPLLRRFLTDDVVLVMDVERETPEVIADPAHVEQVLANLVINARDALRTSGHVTVGAYPPGSPRSWAGREEWVVDDGFVEISVLDDGVGMDADTRERIFEPFFTTKPRERGTGLGLSSVHGIMSQNGGKIRVLSEPDAGACFLLYWPVATSGRAA